MEEIELIFPEMRHKMAALAYNQEHFDHGEYSIQGSALLDKMESYEEWLKMIRDNSNEKPVRKSWVPSSTYFAFRKTDGKLIGMIDFRHQFNEYLRNFGGNIGYSVCPSERKKGYAVQMLYLILEKAKQIGLRKVMLSCYQENAASRRTIEKCGGILEKEIEEPDGKTLQVYWIQVHS